MKKSEGVVMREKSTKLSLSCAAFLFICMLACVVCVASAKTIYVPDDHARIQWAVDNASAGDTIIVRDGTYYENVIVDKALTIHSENGSANCIVDAALLIASWMVEAVVIMNKYTLMEILTAMML